MTVTQSKIAVTIDGERAFTWIGGKKEMRKIIRDVERAAARSPEFDVEELGWGGLVHAVRAAKTGSADTREGILHSALHFIFTKRGDWGQVMDHVGESDIDVDVTFEGERNLTMRVVVFDNTGIADAGDERDRTRH